MASADERDINVGFIDHDSAPYFFDRPLLAPYSVFDAIPLSPRSSQLIRGIQQAATFGMHKSLVNSK